MAAWIHKGDLGGSADPVTNGHTVSVVAGKDGHNAFSVAYQGNDEEGYIEYLCQNIYSDAAKRIKPDMTDDDVNEVYEKGLARIKGLKYEIDRLRREYLARKMTE